MAEKWQKWVAAGKWQEMDFRVLYVVVIEVARQAMAEKGKKWVATGKWQEMDFRVFCS